MAWHPSGRWCASAGGRAPVVWDLGDGPDAPPPVFVSLHKRCLAPEAHSPAEAFRLSPLLEAGARVVAQRSHPRDEAFYNGAAVKFAPLSALANTVASELATPDSPAAAAKRAAAFRRAFDVGDAFRRFGLIRDT